MTSIDEGYDNSGPRLTLGQLPTTQQSHSTLLRRQLATLALNLVLSLFLQDGLGFGPLAAAAMALPSAVGFAAASTTSAHVVARYGRRGICVALDIAAAAIAANDAAVALLPAAGLVAALAVAQLLTGAAGGLVNAPNQALTLAHVPADANGLSAALLQLSQRLAAGVSIAAVSAVFLAGGAYRDALLHGVLLCLALVLLALLFAVADGVRPTRPTRVLQVARS